MQAGRQSRLPTSGYAMPWRNRLEQGRLSKSPSSLGGCRVNAGRKPQRPFLALSRWLRAVPACGRGRPCSELQYDNFPVSSVVNMRLRRTAGRILTLFVPEPQRRGNAWKLRTRPSIHGGHQSTAADPVAEPRCDLVCKPGRQAELSAVDVGQTLRAVSQSFNRNAQPVQQGQIQVG